jgi:hypothetical protein
MAGRPDGRWAPCPAGRSGDQPVWSAGQSAARAPTVRSSWPAPPAGSGPAGVPLSRRAPGHNRPRPLHATSRSGQRLERSRALPCSFFAPAANARHRPTAAGPVASGHGRSRRLRWRSARPHCRATDVRPPGPGREESPPGRHSRPHPTRVRLPTSTRPGWSLIAIHAGTNSRQSTKAWRDDFTYQPPRGLPHVLGAGAAGVAG